LRPSGGASLDISRRNPAESFTPAKCRLHRFSGFCRFCSVFRRKPIETILSVSINSTFPSAGDFYHQLAVRMPPAMQANAIRYILSLINCSRSTSRPALYAPSGDLCMPSGFTAKQVDSGT
jgi:hypothetical protein